MGKKKLQNFANMTGGGVGTSSSAASSASGAPADTWFDLMIPSLSTLRHNPTIEALVGNNKALSVSLATAAALGLGLSLGLVAARAWKGKAPCLNAQNKGGETKVVVEKLLPVEELILANNEPSVTTITFFKGRYERASEVLRGRVEAIVKKNPWLLGSVSGKHLVYPVLEETQVPSCIPQEMFQVKKLDLHRDTPYETIGEVLEGFVVLPGRCSMLWRNTVIPDASDENRFALVTSMSHVAGDGNTYYQIFNQLCGSMEITALSPARKADCARAIEDLTKTRRELMGPSFFIGIALRMLYGATLAREKVHARMAFLSDAWVTKSKKEAKAKGGEGGGGGVGYISTNDAVTSWFFRKSRNCRLSLMAVNFRNRVENCASADAGNYEDMIYYLPGDVETPGLIRKSLGQFKRAGSPETVLPSSFLGRLGLNGALVTNWSTFYRPGRIPDCVEDLHLPVALLGHMPHFWTLCVIFRPTPTKLGLFLCGLSGDIKEYEEEDGGPLGESVC